MAVFGLLFVVGLLFLELVHSVVPGVYVEELEGYPEQGYAVNIAVGTPGQAMRAIVDTGSSNFAVAANSNVNISRHFDKGSSSTIKCSGRSVQALYQFGSWHGSLCQDVIKFDEGPMEFTHVALIERSRNFFIKGAIWQGILGLAYASIARPDESVRSVLDSLVSSGHIANTFSIGLCGRVSASRDFSYKGKLVFGDTKNSAFQSSLVFTNLLEENFYTIVILDVQVAGKSLDMDCQSYNKPRTFVDSGTTFLALPPDVFVRLVARIQKHLNGSGLTPSCARRAKFWTGALRCPAQEGEGFLAAFPTISLWIPDSMNTSFAFSLSMPPHLYLQGVPCTESSTGLCYLFSVQESSGGTILGTVLMEGYHVVFDRQHKRIGFADSACTTSVPYLSKPPVSRMTLRQDFREGKSCRYPVPNPNGKQSPMNSTIVFVAVTVGIMLFVLCSWDSCFGSGGRWQCPTSFSSSSSDLGESPERQEHATQVRMSDVESREQYDDNRPLLETDDQLLHRLSLSSLNEVPSKPKEDSVAPL